MTPEVKVHGRPRWPYTTGPVSRSVVTLKLIRIEYDAYNRSFKLLDPAAGLKDGEIYFLMDPSQDLQTDSVLENPPIEADVDVVG